jgi:hypothetical protein
MTSVIKNRTSGIRLENTAQYANALSRRTALIPYVIDHKIAATL